jgi:hypothetical protein
MKTRVGVKRNEEAKTAAISLTITAEFPNNDPEAAARVATMLGKMVSSVIGPEDAEPFLKKLEAARKKAFAG